jgi:competence protein ComEA
MIYITGAVQSPGIYSLTRPARVNDAVLAAGGLLPSADPVSVNLAAKIEDGSQTVVASIDVSTGSSSGLNVSAPKPSQTPHLTPTVSYPIDINTAPQSLLEELPGIGPSKASAIITYRQEHGPFTKIEDILNVPGIGTGLFNSTKDLITVSTLP